MKRNRFALIAVFLLVGINGWAQTFFARTYGDGGLDIGRSIQTTSDGGFIVAGETSSFGAGIRDFWILKMDPSGDIQWQKTYGGTNNDIARSIQPLSDGSFIVAGETSSFGAGLIDFWILKLDSSGNIQWQKSYGGTKNDSATSIQATSDGGYIVAGQTESFGAGSYDFLILKLDSSGNIQWQKTYGGTNWDSPSSIQTTSDGGSIVTGSTISFGAGNFDVWILKLDSSGNIQWQKTYGGSLGDYGRSIQINSNGGYIVAAGTATFGAGGIDFWVLNLDSSGNIQWQKTYGGIFNDDLNSFEAALDGGYIAAGYTQSFGAGFNDIWILKLDSSGNIQWQKTHGGNSEEIPYSVEESPDGRILVTGLTLSYGMGSQEVWILRLASNGEIDPSCTFDTGAAVADTAVIAGEETIAISSSVVTAFSSAGVISDTAAGILEQCARTNNPPVAVNDSYSTQLDTPLTVTPPGVLSNDSDADGDPISAILVNGPANGTLSLNANGGFNYTPNTGFVGVDTFTYVANDGVDDSNIATVSITVSDNTNNPPVATDDSYMTPLNTTLTVPPPGVLSNDSDEDGDPISAVLVSEPANGTLILNANGGFKYTPNAGFVGLDTFTYLANDGVDNSNIATVTITIYEDCLFCDNFADGVLDPNWTYEKPDWVEAGGYLIGTPAKNKAIAIASPAFAGCTNCGVEVSLKAAGGQFNKVWIYMHYADKNTLTELLIKEENDKVVLKQRINKSVVSKNKALITINPNTEYVFRIVFDGTQYSVFLDGTLLFTMNPVGPVPAATVGFAAKKTSISVGHIIVN